MVFFIGMRIATLFCSFHTFKYNQHSIPPPTANEVGGGGFTLSAPVCGHDFVHASSKRWVDGFF